MSEADQRLADEIDNADRRGMGNGPVALNSAHMQPPHLQGRRARRQSRQRTSLSALIDEFEAPERVLDNSEVEMAIIQQQIAEIDRATAAREARESASDQNALSVDNQNQQ